MAAMRALTYFYLDSIAAKAQAALIACLFCIDLGLSNVILEGDANVVVDVVKSSQENFSKYGHLVEEIKLFIHGYDTWQIHYVIKDFNQVAHLLAKDALLCNSVCIDMEDVLIYLRLVVLCELIAN